VVYVNDAAGGWDGDAPGRIERALRGPIRNRHRSGGDIAHRKIVLTGAPVENSDGGSGSLVPSTKRITPVSA
jgi:hypothetical protein